MPLILRTEQEKIYLDKSIPKDDLVKLLKNHIEESEISFHTISNLITSRTENLYVEEVQLNYNYSKIKPKGFNGYIKTAGGLLQANII